MVKVKPVWKLTASTLLLGLGMPANVQAQWQAETGVPPGLIQQAILENASQPLTPEDITIQTVQNLGQEVPLYLIAFKNANLCGANGCLHVGYIPAGEAFQRVLGISLTDSNITISNRLENGLPCLSFPVPPDSEVEWCYNGSKYQISK